MASKKPKKIYSFPVLIEKDESGYYVGRVPSLRSCYTQAKTIAQLYKRLKEVIELCLEAEEKDFKKPVPKTEFVGVHLLQLVH